MEVSPRAAACGFATTRTRRPKYKDLVVESDMPETPQDLDAVLADVNALAKEVANGMGGAKSVEQFVSPPAQEPPAPTPTSAPQPPTAAPKRPAPRKEDPRRILNLEVPVIVQLAERTLPLAEILNLTSGAIIEFDKTSDSQLDLMINNKCIGQGQPVKVGENFGLRIDSIGSVRDRIKALGHQ